VYESWGGFAYWGKRRGEIIFGVDKKSIKKQLEGDFSIIDFKKKRGREITSSFNRKGDLKWIGA